MKQTFRKYLFIVTEIKCSSEGAEAHCDYLLHHHFCAICSVFISLIQLTHTHTCTQTCTRMHTQSSCVSHDLFSQICFSKRQNQRLVKALHTQKCSINVSFGNKGAFECIKSKTKQITQVNTGFASQPFLICITLSVAGDNFPGGSEQNSKRQNKLSLPNFNYMSPSVDKTN